VLATGSLEYQNTDTGVVDTGAIDADIVIIDTGSIVIPIDET
jgi:hypothetical protein